MIWLSPGSYPTGGDVHGGNNVFIKEKGRRKGFAELL